MGSLSRAIIFGASADAKAARRLVPETPGPAPASLDSERIPPLPAVIARTDARAPLLPVRLANALATADVRTLGDLTGWTFEQILVLERTGLQSARAAFD